MLLRKTIHLSFLLLMAGCTQKSPRQRLVDFVNDPDNKITQSIQIGNTKIISKLLPYEYRNLNKNNTAEDHYTYFNIKIVSTKEKPAKEKLLYLDFDMQHDFLLLPRHDSIAPAICQRIENGKAGSYEYIIAFNTEQSRTDFTLFYKDKMFGIGTVAFVYAQKDILKIPRL